MFGLTKARRVQTNHGENGRAIITENPSPVRFEIRTKKLQGKIA